MKKLEFLEKLKKYNLSSSKTNMLLQEITGLSKERLFMSGNDLEIDDNIAELYLKQFSDNRPFEYIIGESEFMGLTFYVDERVLIPRDDTEVLVYEALKEGGDLLIDVGSGSGTIPIAFLKNVDKKTDIVSLDISELAIEVSKINMKKHRISYEIQKSDLLSYTIDNVDILKNKDKILITANLPYIKSGDFENMDREVYLHEPELALYGGENTGFELYEKLIYQIQDINSKVKAKIILFIEIGFDQKEHSNNYLKEKGLKFEYFKDTSNIDRVVKIYF